MSSSKVTNTKKLEYDGHSWPDDIQDAEVSQLRKMRDHYSRYGEIRPYSKKEIMQELKRRDEEEAARQFKNLSLNAKKDAATTKVPGSQHEESKKIEPYGHENPNSRPSSRSSSKSRPRTEPQLISSDIPKSMGKRRRGSSSGSSAPQNPPVRGSKASEAQRQDNAGKKPTGRQDKPKTNQASDKRKRTNAQSSQTQGSSNVPTTYSFIEYDPNRASSSTTAYAGPSASSSTEPTRNASNSSGRIYCPEEGCPRKGGFARISDYQEHIKTKHPKSLKGT